MRAMAWIGLAACTMLVVLAASNAAAAADDDAATACLSSNAYLDFVDTVDLCDPASRAGGLGAKTLSAVNIQLGEAHYFAFRPGLAIPYLDEAIKFDRQADQAYRHRGWAHLMQGEYTAAMGDFTEYLAQKPDDPDAQFAMAFARGELTGICWVNVRNYEGILANHPDHYITRFNLAAAYSCSDGNRVRELEELGKILAASREEVAKVTYYGRNGRDDLDFYAFAMDRRAGALMDLVGRYDEAIKDFDWVMENYPRYAHALINRSRIRTYMRDYLGGLDDAEAALALFPDRPAAQVAKLLALSHLDRREETIAYATEVLSRGYESSETPRIYFWRGAAYKQLGFRKEAIKDINRAMAASDRIAWSMHTQLVQSGYLFGPQGRRRFDDGGPPPDIRAKEFANAVQACMVDPECMK